MLSGPSWEYSAGDLNALSTMMTNGDSMSSATRIAAASTNQRPIPRR